MAWTQQNVDDMKAALAAAKTSSSVHLPDGYEVTYMTVPNALALLAAMQQDVAAAAAAQPGISPLLAPLRAFRIRHRSGY
jgi:hypothetical protein